MMNQSNPFRHLAVAAFACLMAASCSDGTDDGTTLPDGKYPMTFTASVGGLTATRATPDNSWAGGEEVAIQIGSEVKKYTAANDGSLTIAENGTPFYWQTTSDITVNAWYPYSTTKPTVAELRVKANQSEGNNYQSSDYLEAVDATVTFNTPAALIFKHRTAKVVVTLKAGEGVTDVANAAVTFVNQTGVDGGGTEVTPKNETIDGVTTYTALVIPQQMKDKKFIAVTLTNGNTYYYTPAQDNAADLQSGRQHTYDITVKHGYLEVSTNTGGSAWGSDGSAEEVTGKTPSEGYAPDNLKIGDYYYSDGKTSDGGYRKYSDGSTAIMPIQPVLTDADGKERTVIGIVFWVGDATARDNTLATDHSGCMHGLVVALTDASGITAWQSPRASVQAWLDSNRKGDFLAVNSNMGTNDPLNNIQGYNNTKAIEAFNEANSGNKVQAVETVVAYRIQVKAPSNSSGWYLPSEKELTLLCGKEVEDIVGNKPVGTANRDLINKKIESISGAVKIVSAFYGSSTEYGRSNAFYVNFINGNVNYDFKHSTYRLRCALAF
jgi:hypothetical protein